MYKTFSRFLSLYLIFTLIIEPTLLNHLQALTSGPNQPEFSSFEPVATTTMVNDFTGDFVYNLPVIEIPGPHGSSYAMSLSYHSGTSPEEEASWVGYGWTLNPGSITRNLRGFPDDYNGTEVDYYNKVPKNWTVSLTGTPVEFELFSIDALGVSADATLRYNNYKGFGIMKRVNASVVKGVVNLGYSIDDGEGSFSVHVNPMALLSLTAGDAKKNGNSHIAQWQNRRRAKSYKRLSSKLFNIVGSKYGFLSYAEVVRPTNTTKYNGYSLNLSLSVTPTGAPAPLGLSTGLSANYTQQENEPQLSKTVFGYMYSGNVNNNEHVMDYYIEKDLPYQKRDKFLAIPFSNADNFTVSGEGLTGSFRLHNKKPGHFRPDSVKNEFDIVQGGLDVLAGADIGVGVDVGLGWSNVEVGGWGIDYDELEYNFASIDEETDEPYFFKFNNDLGGSLQYSASDDAIQTNLNKNSRGFSLDWSEIIEDNIWEFPNGDEFERVGRSSYIGYHTNKDMTLSSNDIHYKSYTKTDEVLNAVSRGDDEILEQIGEFVTYNEDGKRFVYGLPVYSKNEMNMMYGIKNIPEDNYLVYNIDTATDDCDIKVGEVRKVPYATTYLLTEITTPDYIDRTLNGPTPDDFGGYTKFNYEKLVSIDGDDDNMYYWRIPYQGLLYNKRQISDPDDDVGTVQAGQKEIYYLTSIETKTHIATFETSDRADGLDAAHDKQPENGIIGTTEDGIGIKEDGNPWYKLKKLDRICLYLKNEDGTDGKRIKTVRFEYFDLGNDQQLMKNIPNGLDIDGDDDEDEVIGKLTLKRAWFEYDDVVNAKISPYIFGYEYKDFGYPAKYASDDFIPEDFDPDTLDIDEYWRAYSREDQNPDYEARNIDRWGNYQADGAERHAELVPWVNQDPPLDFDPAAWQLKTIKLPSGGEIHIQYEQDDYSYVQDRPAMAMVSLLTEMKDDTCFLNISDIGILSTSEMQGLRRKLYKTFNSRNEKIYFKFLYQLVSIHGAVEPGIDNNCNSEYITGYVDVEDVGIDDTDRLYVILKGDMKPQDVCAEYAKKNKTGKVDLDGDCSDFLDLSRGEILNTAKDVVLSLLAKATELPGFGGLKLCAKIKPELSYLRIPMATPKKGGGLRVKRLLMFDAGIDGSKESKVLYGREYIYKTVEDGKVISSGVATTEPSTGREENSLVKYLDRESQSWSNKIIAGKDKKQVEGPIGETILPAPSVGYSKVIIKNIHSGITNTGLTIKEFHTAKDSPNFIKKSKYTDILEKPKHPWPKILIFYNRLVNNLWLTQGFKFIINNMHGQQKAVSTYNADYSYIFNPDKTATIAKQEFFYFDPNDEENVPLFHGLVPDEEEGAKNTYPGKEMEVVFETKRVSDISKDFSLEVDGSLGIFGIIFVPYVTAFPVYVYQEAILSTHVTTKVVRYPAILKKVRSEQDNTITITENIKFNPETGKPVLTRTYDGFHGLDLPGEAEIHDGSYNQYSIPATTQYTSMGQKAMNVGSKLPLKPTTKIVKNESLGKLYLQFKADSSYSVCDDMQRLFPGDLVMIDDENFYHIGQTVGNEVELIPITKYSSPTSTDNSDAGVTVEVIESGRTNQLNAITSQITTYSETAVITHDLPISAINLGMRNELKDILNALLNSFEYDPANPEAARYGAGISGEEKFILIAGECDSLDKVSPAIKWIAPSTSLIYLHPGTDETEFLISRSDDWRNDHFKINNENGQLLYFRSDNECNPVPITEITFCPEVYQFKTLDNVLNANLQTYGDEWGLNDFLSYDILPGNPFETGAKGKWRPKSNYLYKTDVISANNGGRTYRNAGAFTDTLFNYKYFQANNYNHWLRTSDVTLYSPNGNAIEERDIRNNYSTVKFGYDHSVPFLVAENANYGSVFFESYEKTYDSERFEDGLPKSYDPDPFPSIRHSYIALGSAHSGQHSMRLAVPGIDPSGYYIDTSGEVHFSTIPIPFDKLRLHALKLTEQLWNSGFSVKAWVKSEYPSVELDGLLKLSLWDETAVKVYEVPMSKIARTGEWALYESIVKRFKGVVVSTKVFPEIRYENLHNNSIWIDDIRIQPLDAKMTAYVYDTATLRLLTSFDDQHFGTYYQYNSEGKLVRKMIETEQGMKTLQETQYHTPQKAER